MREPRGEELQTGIPVWLNQVDPSRAVYHPVESYDLEAVGEISGVQFRAAYLESRRSLSLYVVQNGFFVNVPLGAYDSLLSSLDEIKIIKSRYHTTLY